MVFTYSNTCQEHSEIGYKMSKKFRWVSPQIRHLGDYLGLAIIDVRSGNKTSALNNLGFASGIQKAMAEKDKKGTRSIERMGKTIKVVAKHLEPLLKKLAREAARAAVKEAKRNGKF